MRCAPHKMCSYLLYLLARSCGFAKMTAKQPTGLFAPFDSLIFPYRSPSLSKESYTDMPLLPGYDWVDVSVLYTVKKIS